MMSSDRRYGLAQLANPTEADELFGRAHPNPDRVGCPPRDVLVALARRQRPIGDPAYDHLKECSPCYLEGRVIQEADGRHHHRTLIGAVAAVFGVAVGVGVWMRRRSRSDAIDSEIHAQVDLRLYEILPEESRTKENPQLQLPRGRVALRLVLPPGSEPGPYELEIRGANAIWMVSAHGDAHLRNHMTTLDLSVATGSLSPGSYQLAVRHVGDRWQEFPLRVH